MRASNRFMSLFCFLFLFFLICPGNAHAYLDLGTGSYIFQLLIAGLLGASLAVKIFWQNIRDFFKALLSRKEK